MRAGVSKQRRSSDAGVGCHFFGNTVFSAAHCSHCCCIIFILSGSCAERSFNSVASDCRLYKRPGYTAFLHLDTFGPEGHHRCIDPSFVRPCLPEPVSRIRHIRPALADGSKSSLWSGHRFFIDRVSDLFAGPRLARPVKGRTVAHGILCSSINRCHTITYL